MGQEFRKVRAGTVCCIASGTSARTTRRLGDFMLRAGSIWRPLHSRVWQAMLVRAGCWPEHLFVAYPHSHPGNLMLLAWRLVALKMSVPREPGRSCIAFYDLASEVTVSLP